MTPSPAHDPDTPGGRIRMGARLDAATRQTVDDLARRFHRPRAAVLGYIMHWGLSRGEALTPDQGASHGPVRDLSCAVDADLHARVQQAAAAAGVKMAPWLRHMVRQIAVEEFPASWQEVRSAGRSHDSRVYGTRFMLRLDHPTRAKLAALSAHFHTSIAAVIRQLVAQAEPIEFPHSWQTRVHTRGIHHARPSGPR